MKIPRLITRRRVKWVALVGSTLAALLFSMAMFVHAQGEYWRESSAEGMGFMTDGGAVTVYWGSGVFRGLEVPGVTWRIRWQRDHRIQRWFQRIDRGGGAGAFLVIPIWPFVLLIAAPTVYLWYTDRRAKPWQCPKCRYDLRGLEGGDCPECGRPTEREA